MPAHDPTAGDGPRARLRLVDGTGARAWSSPAPGESPERARAESRASHPSMGGRRRPLLYVGAEVDGRVLFTRMARRWRAVRVLVAQTGRAGVRIASERRLGIVVMHAALPDADAVDVMVTIRARGMAPAVPVVVIAEQGSSAERARFLWAGASAYVRTPLRVDEVDRAVGMLLEAAAVR